MKRFIVTLCCLMVIPLLAASCSKKDDDVQQDSTDVVPKVEETTESLAPPMVLVNADGTADCTVTKPIKCSEELEAAIDEFVRTVEKKTGVRLPVVDEYSEINTRYELAVNATAGRPPAEEQLKQTGYTDYVVGIWDWHIMLTAQSDGVLRQGLKKIAASLETIDEGYCIREDMKLQVSAFLGEKKTSVPVYDTQNGTKLPFYSVNGGYEVCIQNTSKDETLAYADKLSRSGLSKHSENAIGDNLTYAFAGEDINVFVNYNASLKTARIVFENATELPSTVKPGLSASDTAKVSVAQIDVGGLGMSYVIQLKDYSFIVVDGGTEDAENVKKLYDYIVDKTPSGKKPTIECWIFTHADPDHIGAPHAFLDKYMENVSLKSVAYNFPDCSVQDTSQNDEEIGASIFALENLINRFYGATVYNVHTGQKLHFKGCEIEVLFTEEDIYPRMPANYNDTSLMMRFTFDSGKTFMLLGDSTVKNSKQLAATYGDYLKSDILQLAHHGLVGGDKQLYMYIDPEICFWATGQERFEGNWDTNKDGKVNANDVQHCLGQGGCDYNKYIRDDSIRRRTHYHGGQLFVVTVD